MFSFAIWSASARWRAWNSGRPTTNARTPRAGSGSAQRGLGLDEQRLVHRADDRFDQRLLGREVAADRADADPGAAGDLFDRRLQPRFREDRFGRGEHPLAVAAGVGTPRPAAARSSVGFVSSGSMIPIIVGIRKRSSTSGSPTPALPPPRTSPGVTMEAATQSPADVAFDRRWWTLAVLCLSLLIVFVGNSSLNVAIPTLSRELHATESQLQWVVAVYSLVFAGSPVLDRRARRPLRAQGRAAARSAAVPRSAPRSRRSRRAWAS